MAKLKEGISFQPFGERSEPFQGEVSESTAQWLLEKGIATPEDFEVSVEGPKEDIQPVKKSNKK
jgi:hypothetical protein